MMGFLFILNKWVGQYIYNKISYMSKIIRLTESDLVRLVKRVIEEQAPESVYDFDKEEKQRLSRRNNKIAN